MLVHWLLRCIRTARQLVFRVAVKSDSVTMDPWLQNMSRIQISLDQDLYSRAKSMARQKGISLAELGRRSLREAVERPWITYAGVPDGEPDHSETVDEVVYGRDMP